jgi:tRNA synthetases class II (A)
MKYQSNELRKKYLDFFKSKNHVVIPSAPVVPDNDPTVLFNTA